MLLHGKFIGVVHPRITNAHDKKNTRHEVVKINKNKDVEIEKLHSELKETKDMIRQMMQIVLQQQSQTIHVESKEISSVKRTNDIFQDIDIKEHTDKMDINIKAQKDKIKRNIDADIALLTNVDNHDTQSNKGSIQKKPKRSGNRSKKH